MEWIFYGLICLGGALGFAMGWGSLGQKLGCALLCLAPAIIFIMISVEPMFTGERQSSTAGLAIPFGSLWIACASAIGAVVGAVGRRLMKR